MKNFVAFGLLALSATVAGQSDTLPEVQYLNRLIEQASVLCDGKPPVKCQCDNDPTVFMEPPFDFFKAVICNPGICNCADGSEVNGRPEEMQKLMSLCPRGKMEGCECADGKFQELPFDLRTFFFKCRPTQCRCKNDSQMKVVDVFGCPNGGALFCEGKNDFACRNEKGLLRKVDKNDLILARLDNRCVCQHDNAFPVCRRAKDSPRCPDGNYPVFTPEKNPGTGFVECDLPDVYKN